MAENPEVEATFDDVIADAVALANAVALDDKAAIEFMAENLANSRMTAVVLAGWVVMLARGPGDVERLADKWRAGGGQ